MPGAGATAGKIAAEEFPLRANHDVMTVLAQMLSNQHVFFAGV